MFQEIKKNIKMAVLSEYKLIICILAVLIVFWKIINTLISESIVNITETVADNNMIVALIFFLCPVFTVFIRFDSLRSETKIFSQRHLWEFFLFAIYLLFKRLGNFDFYSYCGISYVSYSFIGLLFTELGLYCLYRKDFHILASLYKATHPFFIDAPTTDDSYDRKNFLKTLLDKILSTFDNRYFVENPNAFTILLSESFGIGKTSFLFQVKKAIREEEYKNKIIYVEFRPWLCEKPETIVTEFFSVLHQELDKHFVLPKGMFSSYLSLLVENAPNTYYSFMLKSLHKKRSLSEEHDRIMKFLKQIDRPILISIDDVDRLHDDEVKVVLNLIRDTADFPNLFYIVAADKKNLCLSMERLDIKAPERFLKKFINFECLFPANDAVLKQLFREKLDSLLRKYSCTGSKDLIINSILEIDNIIDAFETPRDIVRFLNIFTFAMDCIERNEIMNEINVADLFAISLIQYLEIGLYKILRDDDGLLLSYDNSTKSLSISSSYKSVFEHPIFAHINEKTKGEEHHVIISDIDDVIAEISAQKQIVYRYVVYFLFDQQRKDINGYSMRYVDSYFRYFAFTKKRTQISGAKVRAVFSPAYEELYKIEIKDIIQHNQENSFIHNTSKWYHTFDDSKIEILKKLSTFVALLCELKPENVSADKTQVKALNIKYFMEAYEIHKLLVQIYFNELKSYPSAIVSQEEFEKRYGKDRNDFDEYIKTRKYEINFISIVLNKISINKEYSLLGNDNIERWSRQIIDNYIVELKKYDKEHTFSRNNLYTISHVAVLDTYYWIDSFKDYIKESSYFMDWIARVASYENNMCDWNELLRQQLNFPHWQNHEIWKQIITNSNYKETPVLTDLMEILNKDLKSLNKSTHPYLDFVESYWKNNDMYK
ncbi:P-loop NTPase fold protein [Segatella salivae]|jgi:KAP P-loop domain protein|uniref:P-loop NTPase fold protein n=1 Tax=Segatella salivae TaxID=228604 RepID=UPI00248E4F6C|nr:P-loop NTPase fold protein [Segatella salivae]